MRFRRQRPHPQWPHGLHGSAKPKTETVPIPDHRKLRVKRFIKHRRERIHGVKREDALSALDEEALEFT
jgi:hypothetical protein